MSEILKPIEQCATGKLRIVYNPKHQPAIDHSDPWIELFGVTKEGDRDLVDSTGKVWESCETERAAQQSAGFYGFMFGM